MGLFDRDRSAERTPVGIITGFLGAGKTTLLNRLLVHPAMDRALVIVNEFGEIGLDHLFIESRDVDLVLLSSGCICCTVRGDLDLTLRDLAARRQTGAIPPFDRVLIETTGLADPGPIAALLLHHPLVMHDFRLAAIVAVVDAVNGMRQLDEHAEALAQAAVADTIVLSKTDIAAPAAVRALEARLSSLAPQARRRAAAGIDPAELFAAEAAPAIGPDAPPPAPHPAGCADPLCAHPEHGGRHDARIRTVSIVHDRPLPWATANRWLQGVRATWSDGLLRLKGLVAVAGQSGPVVVHGVHSTFHPPVALEAWPDGDRRTRIVLIVRDVAPEDIVSSFHQVLAEAADA